MIASIIITILFIIIFLITRDYFMLVYIGLMLITTVIAIIWHKREQKWLGTKPKDKIKEDIIPMFSNLAVSGKKNAIGTTVATMRKNLHISQRELADRLNAIGLMIDKNAVQRIESGQRFVTDIELPKIAKVFNVKITDLYTDGEISN